MCFKPHKENHLSFSDSRVLASPVINPRYALSHDEHRLSQLVLCCRVLSIKTEESKYLDHSVIDLSLLHIFCQHVLLWNATGRTPLPLLCPISYLSLHFVYFGDLCYKLGSVRAEFENRVRSFKQWVMHVCNKGLILSSGTGWFDY